MQQSCVATTLRERCAAAAGELTRRPSRATVSGMAAPVRSPWLAIDAVTDRPAYARSLRRVHDAFHSGHEVAGHVRAVVDQSWARSGEAGIDPCEGLAPLVMDEDAIADRWEHHPLYAVLPCFATSCPTRRPAPATCS